MIHIYSCTRVYILHIIRHSNSNKHDTIFILKIRVNIASKAYQLIEIHVDILVIQWNITKYNILIA